MIGTITDWLDGKILDNEGLSKRRINRTIGKLHAWKRTLHFLIALLQLAKIGESLKPSFQILSHPPLRVSHIHTSPFLHKPLIKYSASTHSRNMKRCQTIRSWSFRPQPFLFKTRPISRSPCFATSIIGVHPSLNLIWHSAPPSRNAITVSKLPDTMAS